MDLLAQKRKKGFGRVRDLVQEFCNYLEMLILCNHCNYTLGEQSLMSVSQVSPVNPALQEHRNPPGVLVQVPRFLQGLEMHSFTSILHS